MPPANKVDIPESERLKALGNAHYRDGEHAAAQHKYTEAIKKNPGNAVLYANRAAVLLAKKQYMDVIDDCRKAVELDPSYAKAWGRLGLASYSVNSPVESLKYYLTALDCLPQPPTTLTATDQALKTQFTEGVAKAKVAIRRMGNSDASGAKRVDRAEAEMPWNRAQALYQRKKEEFLATRKWSCVMMVDQANAALKLGMEKLGDAKVLGTTPKGELQRRHMSVLEALSNSILMCDRIFHADEAGTFLHNLDQQGAFLTYKDVLGYLQLTKAACNLVIFEDEVDKGWVEDRSGPEHVKVEALKRLKKEGREAMRRAITVTVRAWIFQGVLRANMLGHRQLSHDLLTNALEILEWGMKEWSNVPDEQRGAIFARSFIRAVKRLKIHNMLEMAMSPKKGEDWSFTLEDIIDISEDLIEDCQTDKPKMDPMDVGAYLSFWLYPKAIAHSAIGWCTLQQLQKSLGTPWVNPAILKMRKDLHNLHIKASLHYLQAAESIPIDDNYHVDFLRKHLEMLSDRGAPLKETLPIAQRVLAGAEEAIEIWGSKAFSGKVLQQTIIDTKDYVEKCKKDLEVGVCQMEDGVRPFRHRMWTDGKGGGVGHEGNPVAFKFEFSDALKAFLKEDEKDGDKAKKSAQ